MNTDCGQIRESIPRKLVGDLTTQELQHLDAHLEFCAECRQEEHLYLRTFEHMRAGDDVPAPRHFFVYDQERSKSPWDLFRSMSFVWQGATATAVLAFVLLCAVTVAGLRVQFGPGAMIVSFGGKAVTAEEQAATMAEMQALESRILQIAEQRNRKETLEWVRTLREEMAQGNRNLDQRQRTMIQTALNSVENRLETRITESAQALENTTAKSLSDLYATVNLQRERDVTAFSERLSKVALNGETRSNQTDVILDALLQAAELRLRQ
jgi:hypothetical protein